MNTIQIYVVKEQKDEVLEEYPNLSADVLLPVHTFETSKDFRYATDSQIRKFSKKALTKKAIINTDYDFSRKEEFKVVQNYKKKDPVFEGDVEMPKKLVRISKEYDGEGRIQVKGGDT